MFCINSELFSGCFFLEKEMRTKKKKNNCKNGCKTLSYHNQIQEAHQLKGVCARALWWSHGELGNGVFITPRCPSDSKNYYMTPGRGTEA